MASYDVEATWTIDEVSSAPKYQVRDVWINTGTSYPKLKGVIAVAAGYRKNAVGEIELKGTVKGGTVGQAAFVLPAGYRPVEEEVRVVHSEDAQNSVLGTVTVKTTGEVVVSTGGNALVVLDGIRFSVA